MALTLPASCDTQGPSAPENFNRVFHVEERTLLLEWRIMSVMEL